MNLSPFHVLFYFDLRTTAGWPAGGTPAKTHLRSQPVQPKPPTRATKSYKSPRLMARNTACVRSLTRNFSSMEDTWFFTVPSDLCIAREISRLL